MRFAKGLLRNPLLVAGVPASILAGRALAKAASDDARQRVYSHINRDIAATGLRVQDVPRDLTPEQWREDLRCLSEEMPRRFIYFDALVDREAFDAAVAELDERIPSLARDQIIFEMMRVVALANAGHTLISPWQPAVGWRVLPLRLYVFDDGVYVTHASRKHRRAIGARVLKIGDADIDRVLHETRPYIAADNDAHAKQEFCRLIAPFAEAFHAPGYTEAPSSTRFLLEDDAGTRFATDVKPLPIASLAASLSLWPMYAYRGGIRPPAVITDRNDRYWFEHWEESRTVYLRFSGVRDNPEGESIAEFAERLRKFVDAHDFDRLIVDIRHNTGGDNTLVKPLVELLRTHERINRRGRLFVIIDRETFSAAVSFATALERRTKAIFVGEPSGGMPNTIGDADSLLVLPNSKLIVRLSWRYWQQSAPEDTRRWILPDVPVSLTHRDYFDGRDPAVEAILSYQPEPIEEVALDEADRRRYVGKYLFNPNQLLIVSDQRGRLRMTITDFEEFAASVLYPVSQTRLLSDIADVELRLEDGRDAPIVFWKGVEIGLARVPDGFMLPIQLLQAGRLDEATAAFRKNKANGVRLDARFEFAICDVGASYLQQGKRDEAMRVADLCIELIPLSEIGVERRLAGLR